MINQDSIPAECKLRRSKRFFFLLDSKGQSAVEYLLVSFCLVATLLSAPSIYSTISETMANKYKSYSFGVSISDPPTKAFDDGEEKAGKIIHAISAVFKAIEDLIEDLVGISPHGKMPAEEAIKKFINTLKGIFHK